MKNFCFLAFCLFTCTVFAQQRYSVGANLATGISTDLTKYRPTNNRDKSIHYLVGAHLSAEIIEENNLSYGLELGYLEQIKKVTESLNRTESSEGNIWRTLFRFTYYFNGSNIKPYASMGLGPNIINLKSTRTFFNSYDGLTSISRSREKLIVFNFNPRIGSLLKLNENLWLNLGLDYNGVLLEKQHEEDDTQGIRKGISNYYNFTVGLNYRF